MDSQNLRYLPQHVSRSIEVVGVQDADDVAAEASIPALIAG